MKKIVLVAYILILGAVISGCNTVIPNPDKDFSPYIDLPPHISTNDFEVINEYYDGDLTPGNNGADLTE